ELPRDLYRLSLIGGIARHLGELRIDRRTAGGGELVAQGLFEKIIAAGGLSLPHVGIHLFEELSRERHRRPKSCRHVRSPSSQASIMMSSRASRKTSTSGPQMEARCRSQ